MYKERQSLHAIRRWEGSTVGLNEGEMASPWVMREVSDSWRNSCLSYGLMDGRYLKNESGAQKVKTFQVNRKE